LFEIRDEHIGMRLDRALCLRFGLSRAQAKRLIEDGCVRMRGKPVAKGMALSAGMALSVELSEGEVTATPDPDFRLTVVFEDATLVVVDKPAGIPSHPLRTGELGCAANMLVARYPEMAEVGYGPREPGLVHRLDNDTSGLLLAARTQEAFLALRDQLMRSQMQKTYLALVSRAVSVPRSIALALAPNPNHSRKVEVTTDPDVRPSVTELVSCEPRGRFFLIEARAAHAYRHQIRVHLAAIDAPIVGDALYGGELEEGVTHHLLHASRIVFRHPVDDREIAVESALPSTWP